MNISAKVGHVPTQPSVTAQVDDARHFLLKLAPREGHYLHNDLDYRAGPPDWPGGDDAWRAFRQSEPASARRRTRLGGDAGDLDGRWKGRGAAAARTWIVRGRGAAAARTWIVRGRVAAPPRLGSSVEGSRRRRG